MTQHVSGRSKSTTNRPLVCKRVDVCEYPDGTLEVRHSEHALPYRLYDKLRQVNQAASIENKHLDAALMLARSIQDQLPRRKRNNTEPSRRSQGAHLFPSPVSAPLTDHPCKRGRARLNRTSPIEAVQQMLEKA